MNEWMAASCYNIVATKTLLMTAKNPPIFFYLFVSPLRVVAKPPLAPVIFDDVGSSLGAAGVNGKGVSGPFKRLRMESRANKSPQNSFLHSLSLHRKFNFYNIFVS